MLKKRKGFSVYVPETSEQISSGLLAVRSRGDVSEKFFEQPKNLL